MRPHAGAPLSRHRFLSLSAGGAAPGAAALSGCVMQVSSGVSGAGETVTVMVNSGDIFPEQRPQVVRPGPRQRPVALRRPHPGKGPRYGMAKDFSQDSMSWCNSAAFDKGSTDRTTLAVAVMTTYVDEGGVPVPELQAAASVMYVVPILLIFLVAQRGFVAGMSTSGLK